MAGGLSEAGGGLIRRIPGRGSFVSEGKAPEEEEAG